MEEELRRPRNVGDLNTLSQCMNEVREMGEKNPREISMSTHVVKQTSSSFKFFDTFQSLPFVTQT